MGVNNKKGMMKTSWGKPVHVISFIRTLLVVLAVAVYTVAADDLETLRKKAEAGDAAAQYDLGEMYFAGRGVPEDAAGIGRLKSRFGSDIRAIENYLYTIFQNLDRPRHVEV